MLVAFAPLGCAFVVAVLVGVLDAGSRARRALALAVSLSALGLPWLCPPWPLLRTATAMVAALQLMRAVDLYRERAAPPLPLPVRVWLTTAPVDVRLARRVPHGVDVRAALSFVAYAALVTGAVWAAGAARGLALAVPLRWATALVLSVCVLPMGEALVRFVYRPFGVEPPPVQLAPLRSRSVGELWGERWNRVVQTWLGAHVFRPVARRAGVRAAVVATFAASALLHLYLVAPIAIGPAVWFAAFFFVQAAIVLLETRLHVRRWPAVAAHAWTLTAMLVSFPLAAEGMLAMVGA